MLDWLSYTSSNLWLTISLFCPPRIQGFIQPVAELKQAWTLLLQSEDFSVNSHAFNHALKEQEITSSLAQRTQVALHLLTASLWDQLVQGWESPCLSFCSPGRWISNNQRFHFMDLLFSCSFNNLTIIFLCFIHQWLMEVLAPTSKDVCGMLCRLEVNFMFNELIHLHFLISLFKISCSVVSFKQLDCMFVIALFIQITHHWITWVKAIILINPLLDPSSWQLLESKALS